MNVPMSPGIIRMAVVGPLPKGGNAGIRLVGCVTACSLVCRCALIEQGVITSNGMPVMGCYGFDEALGIDPKFSGKGR